MSTRNEHRGTGALLVSMLKTRLQLASMDADEHVRGTFVVLLLTGTALGLGMLAFIFAGVGAVVYFWDAYRLPAIVAVTLIYAALGILVAYVARQRWHARPKPFEGTLRELERDHDALSSVL